MLRYLLSFTFLLVSITLKSQDFPERLQEKLTQHIQSNPFEKVYLHTDKSHYLLNDTIWIKAYGTVEMGMEIPQATPTVPLYINLYSNLNKEPVVQETIKLEEGMGWGDLVLPRELNPGNYSLIAFSSRSESAGEQYLFAKDIWIGDLKDAFIPRTELDGTLNVSFFPEGGELVEGIKSKVGFKATGDKGLGEEFYGYLLQNEKDTLLRFASNPLGMGSFEFIPEKEAQYSAYVKSLQSKWKPVLLPRAKAKGEVLHLDILSDEGKGIIEVKSNSSTDKNMLLVGISGGEFFWSESFKLEDGSATVRFEKDDFPPGITQITLMEETGLPVAERLVYLHPYAQALLEFATDKVSYSPKDMVNMDITVMDEFGAPIAGDFSVSITDAKQVASDPHATNIFSHFRLGAELKGLVENPYYYFDVENEAAETHLDDLLLTQGWRKFSWERLADESAKPFEFEKGLKLSGQVEQLGGNPIEEPHQITMMVNSSYDFPQVIEGETDKEGRFLFSELDFYDSVSVFVQAYLQADGINKSPKKNNLIKLDDKVLKGRPEKVISGIPVGHLEDLDFEYVVKVGEARNMMEQFVLGQEVLLQEITVEASNLTKPNDARTILYKGKPDFSLPVTREDFVYANAIHFLRNRVPSVQVVGDVFSFQDPPRVLIRGGIITGNASGRPQNQSHPILIDGQPTDVLMAMSLNMIDVERIDVITNLGNRAMMSGSAYINILTKTGNPGAELQEDPRLGQGNDLLFTKGYVTKREFYVPSGKFEEGTPFAQDFRSTLYWNPNLSTQEDGKINISFPLNEGSDSFEVILEGLSSEMEPIYGTFSIKR
ncbi:Plug domain-containing protein [Arthrospiribacter ruber]|uniref:Plug domain-containing protein n=1 Tax=Arthrospiribacter ruber TaxID=2487934 RepID=A0A951MCZ2_9BACT|nr:Plug domain-containing protein [Arthrospiribacter ruber]MBW3467425.1 Plug domain-containing protein [Arthrospiribacter ruber]